MQNAALLFLKVVTSGHQYSLGHVSQYFWSWFFMIMLFCCWSLQILKASFDETVGKGDHRLQTKVADIRGINGEQQQQQPVSSSSTIDSIPSTTTGCCRWTRCRCRCGCCATAIPAPPPPATATASDVLVVPVPRDRTRERLQEPPAPTCTHQEDHEDQEHLLGPFSYTAVTHTVAN
ncbi:hypothetical protein RJT34_19939 [Clitoria ternatea]|uniref:Uncharacterized protein n=1 Tax=Clitoria ternatea TaxID=43366 RepID=A0AAN9ISD8_CLITE